MKKKAEEDTVVAPVIPEGVPYFTTRYTTNGWVAETITNNGKELVRELLAPPTKNRSLAERTMKIGISKYWASL